SLLPHASGAVIVGVRIKQLLAIDLVVGDRFLSFGRHQPVDELLPEVFLDVRMLFRKSIRTSRKTSGSNSSTGWCRPKDRKRSPTTRSMASSCSTRTPTITTRNPYGRDIVALRDSPLMTREMGTPFTRRSFIGSGGAAIVMPRISHAATV